MELLKCYFLFWISSITIVMKIPTAINSIKAGSFIGSGQQQVAQQSQETPLACFLLFFSSLAPSKEFLPTPTMHISGSVQQECPPQWFSGYQSISVVLIPMLPLPMEQLLSSHHTPDFFPLLLQDLDTFQLFHLPSLSPYHPQELPHL